MEEPHIWSYPAITHCIGEARTPDRDELRIVAGRMWHEALRPYFAARGMAASFAARRILLRAAAAALKGGPATAPRRPVHLRRG